MLVFLTLFFTNLSLWLLFFILNSYFNTLYFMFGIIISVVISYLTVKLRLINRQNNFLFLQLGFYKFVFDKINLMFSCTLKFSYYLLTNNKKKFEPTIDHLYIDNSNIYEVNLLVNLLNMLPGVVCIAIRKQYLLVYSLGFEYFIPSDIFILGRDLNGIYDDSLV